MTTLAPLPGDPDSLGTSAERYLGLAETILETAARLTALASDDAIESRAVDEIRIQSTDAAVVMQRLHPRYRDTALALSQYSVRLREAQQQASRAVDAARQADGDLAPLRVQEQHLVAQLAGAILDPDRVQQVTHDLRTVRQHIDALEGQLGSAVSTYDAATHERDTAAELAIRIIAPALDSMNDSLMDHVQAVARGFESFLAQVDQWVRKVLAEVLHDLELVVLALAAYAILVFAVVALALIVMFPLLAIPILLVAVLAIAATLVGALALILGLLLAREAMTPTPPMVKRPGARNGRKATGTHLDPADRYQQTMLADAALDKLGKENATDVQVIKVIGDDGVVRWRVILPSTQDWEWLNGALDGKPDPKGDRGAMNDLGSNIALMADPAIKAAYERSVIEAMKNAGVGPNDPVMLAGWSQGGILAGKMASENPPPFNIQAVFACGAPIDAMPIPSTVSVISVQHTGDIVPQLDLTAAHPDTSNWVTVSADAPPKAVIHNAVSYGTTAHNGVDGAPAGSLVATVRDEQSVFFSDNEESSIWEGHE